MFNNEIFTNYGNVWQVDESGEIIVLEGRCLWKEYLPGVRRTLSLPQSSVKFVIFKDEDTCSWTVEVSILLLL